MSAAGSPFDHARTQTYLRLRAEAELRRVLWLPSDAGGTGADEVDEPAQLSADEGLRRFSVVAHALAQAGTIDQDAADSVTAGLGAALAARSRISPDDMADLLRPRRPGQTARAPAGPYLAVPVGVTVPGGPASELANVQVFALVIAPDRAILTAAGRLRKPRRGRRSHDFTPPLYGSGAPSAIDDLGNSYHVHADASSGDSDGNWTSLLSISPVPPAATRWLELTMSPGSPPVRVDLASRSAGRDTAAGPAAAARPAERIIDTEAKRMLHAALTDLDEGASWYDLSDMAEIVTALDGAGALRTAGESAGRLVTLAERLGVRVPPALSVVAWPAELPAEWRDILENRDRADGPYAVGTAAAVLPELGGTRFVLAGVRSDAAGAELQALSWGVPQPPHLPFFTDTAKQWSWTARDDKGRWHIAAENGGSSDDRHADMELQFVPALHPDARSLEVTLACPSGQVSATVPLDWWE